MRSRYASVAVAAATAILVNLCGATTSRAGHAGSRVSVLLIGSSLVRGPSPVIKRLYRSIGVRAKAKGHGPPRWTLAKHANSSRTAKLIQRRPWDFILLAQSSNGITAAHYGDAAALNAAILANGSAPGLMMTWFEENTPLATYDWLKGSPGAAHGYIPIALQLDVPIAPVGWAIRNSVVDGSPIDLWRKRQHLTTAGRYLVGVVIFTMLTKQSPVGLWAPGSVGAADAAYIQALAADTVLGDPAEWNITLP